MLESLTSLFTLTILEVVLSIDNLVVIAVLVGKLPKDRQANARYVGMTLALLPRLVLLVFIGWIIGLTEPLFELFGHGVSGKDLILAAGGLFLIYKATHEIHAALEGDEGEASAKVMANYAAVVAQIAIINLVFSIDSIVTAVGMANEIWVMAVAVILSMIVLMVGLRPGRAPSSRPIPTVKVLALGFLIMIGMALVADGFGAHVPKGYIYTAMVFSVFIELINMQQRRKAKPVHLRNPYGEETDGRGRRAARSRGGWAMSAELPCRAHATAGHRTKAFRCRRLQHDTLSKACRYPLLSNVRPSRSSMVSDVDPARAGPLLLVEPSVASRTRLHRMLRGTRIRGDLASPPCEQAQAAIAAQQFAYAVVNLRLGRGDELKLIKQLRQLNADDADRRRHRCRQLCLGDRGAARRCRRLYSAASRQGRAGRRAAGSSAVLPPVPDMPLGLSRTCWEHVMRIYEQCDRNVSHTAQRLGMHRRSLQRVLGKRAPPLRAST